MMSRLRVHTSPIPVMRYPWLLGTVAVWFCALGGVAALRPSCIFGDRPIDANRRMGFCPEQDEGACCTQLEERMIEHMYSLELRKGLTNECALYYKEVACGPCNSQANTLYRRLVGELGPLDGMTMKGDFCTELVQQCEGQIEFPDYDGLSYCEKHAGSGITDLTSSYPLTLTEVDTSITLVDAFPHLSDSEIPPRLIAMHKAPDRDEWWLGGQDGEIKKVFLASPNIAYPVLDVSYAEKLYTSQSEGLLDFAFSPAFPVNNYFYVSSTIRGDEGPVNSLARFTYFEDSVAETMLSKDTLLTTLQRDLTTPSARYVGFSPLSYADSRAETHPIYWSVAAGINTEDDSTVVDEDLKCLQSSIVRLDVPSGTGVDDIGYSIPVGNHEGGCSKVCASGLHTSSCAFDSENGDLYCCDMGDTMVEEIDLITCGEDYGWGTFEGTQCHEGESYGHHHHVCDDANLEGTTFPIFEYCHQDFMIEDGGEVCDTGSVIGNDIIGGHVYRGRKYPMLAGALVFADSAQKSIHCIFYEENTWVPRTIIGDNSVSVRSFAEDNEGELYLITSDNRVAELTCGEFCATTCLEQADPPLTFESLGCFADKTKEPALGSNKAPECEFGQNLMTPEVCGAYCQTQKGSFYFGVENGYNCVCGTETESYDRYGPVDMEACSLPCTGAMDELCGGHEAIEVFVYLRAPTPIPDTFSLVGCYGDALWPRLLSGDSVSLDDASLEGCFEFCRGSQYFGLTNGILCSCSTPDDDFMTRDESVCDMLCPVGALLLTCGGEDAISIYEHLPPSPAPSPEDGEDESYTYEGCFVDRKRARVLRSRSFSGSEMTREACKSFCKNYMFFGTEFGEECFCGSPDIFDAEEADNCDMACSGDNNQICGGHDAISVFRKADAVVDKPLGTLVGCFADSKTKRVMPVMETSEDMTNEMCATLCEEYTYYGTQYGEECWCSSATTFRPREESNRCTTECPGDRHKPAEATTPSASTCGRRGGFTFIIFIVVVIAASCVYMACGFWERASLLVVRSKTGRPPRPSSKGTGSCHLLRGRALDGTMIL